MQPQVFKGDLNKLPVKRQKQICLCNKPCNSFITIVGQEDFIMCEAAARDHAFDILRILEILLDVYTKPAPFWTTKDEAYVLDYFKKHGQHNGAYRIIAKHLGRSRDAVKNKVLKMRREGRL